MKVFLGGTINGSEWRDRLVESLEIDYFNPVVDDWNTETMERENREKVMCEFLLFVITPLMIGTYSIAEAVDASNKTPERTIFCILEEDDGKKWESFERKSLAAVEDLIRSNGAAVLESLDDVADYLNHQK